MAFLLIDQADFSHLAETSDAFHTLVTTGVDAADMIELMLGIGEREEKSKAISRRSININSNNHISNTNFKLVVFYNKFKEY